LREPSRNSGEEITKHILTFFLKTPNVADSFAGIARWRLLEEAVERSVARTETALRWLIAEGFLIEETIAGSRSMYRLNPEKRDEAERLVQGGQDSETGVGTP
jgi:hypothetical protein